MGRIERRAWLVSLFAAGDPAIALLARGEGNQIVAGAVVNRSATVIGVSNLFDANGDLELVWQGAAGAARARWGPLPVVGYGPGAALDGAHRAGLASLGELVVWVKPAA
jgi:hypothetical protein